MGEGGRDGGRLLRSSVGAGEAGRDGAGDGERDVGVDDGVGEWRCCGGGGGAARGAAAFLFWFLRFGGITGRSRRACRKICESGAWGVM